MEKILKESWEKGYWILVCLVDGTSFEGTVQYYDENTVLFEMEGKKKKNLKKSEIQSVRYAHCWSD